MSVSLVSEPREPQNTGDVIRFVKYDRYQYAAIKIEDHWYITQSGYKYPVAPMLWVELLEWIGEENWSLMEQMT